MSIIHKSIFLSAINTLFCGVFFTIIREIVIILICSINFWQAKVMREIHTLCQKWNHGDVILFACLILTKKNQLLPFLHFIFHLTANMNTRKNWQKRTKAFARCPVPCAAADSSRTWQPNAHSAQREQLWMLLGSPLTALLLEWKCVAQHNAISILFPIAQSGERERGLFTTTGSTSSRAEKESFI